MTYEPDVATAAQMRYLQLLSLYPLSVLRMKMLSDGSGRLYNPCWIKIATLLLLQSSGVMKYSMLVPPRYVEFWESFRATPKPLFSEPEVSASLTRS